MKWINYLELKEAIQDKKQLSLFSSNINDARFLVVDCDNGQFIFVHYLSQYQVGCWLSEGLRGKGYGSLYFGKAMTLLEQDPPKMLIATTGAGNTPMLKILERYQFVVMSSLEENIMYCRYF